MSLPSPGVAVVCGAVNPASQTCLRPHAVCTGPLASLLPARWLQDRSLPSARPVTRSGGGEDPHFRFSPLQLPRPPPGPALPLERVPSAGFWSPGSLSHPLVLPEFSASPEGCAPFVYGQILVLLPFRNLTGNCLPPVTCRAALPLPPFTCRSQNPFPPASRLPGAPFCFASSVFSPD